MSKLNVGSLLDDRQNNNNSNNLQQQSIRDVASRQVFHEFEKLNTPAKSNTLTSAAGSSGVSPAKSRLQVALAQAQLACNNQKASPAGHLNRQLNNDPMTMAKLSLR